MERKKLLWLTSWYPNKEDAFIGDFIQRHAKAASVHHDIYVLFVKDTTDGDALETVVNRRPGLTEQLIYFRKKGGLSGKLYNTWKWLQLYRQSIKAYIKENGLPAGVHVHVPWKAGLAALWMRRKYGLPYLVTEHWDIYNHVVADNIYRRPLLMRLLLRHIYRRAAKLVTVSQFLASGINEFVPGISSVRLPNVTDTGLFYLQEEQAPVFTFIHVSTLSPKKNIRGLLQAFAAFVATAGEEAAQLMVIGDTDDHYHKVADGLGLLNRTVFFKGEISYPAVAQAVRKAHCLVMFSRSETFSCVTAEALCCGLPVISSAVGALPELINERNGILIPDGDEEALTAALLFMHRNYAGFNRQQICADASGKYAYPAVADLFDKVYKQFFY